MRIILPLPLPLHHHDVVAAAAHHFGREAADSAVTSDCVAAIVGEI